MCDTVRLTVKDKYEGVMWEWRGEGEETDSAELTLEAYQRLVGMKICTNGQTMVKI